MRRLYCWTLMLCLLTLAVTSAGYAQSPPPAGGSTPLVTAVGSGRVTIDVENADITAILRMLSETKKINIISGPEITGLVSVSLHDVPFEDALTAILGVAGFTYYKMGNIYYVTSEAKKKEMPQSASDMMAQTFRINYAEPKELLTAVTEFVSPAGKVVLGANKTIIARDSPGSLAIIQDIIKQLDVPTRQVLIAAHIISVDRKNNLEVGAGVDTPPYNLYGADIVSSGFTKFAPGVASLATAAAKGIKASNASTSSTTTSTGTTGTTTTAAKASTSSTGTSSSTGSSSGSSSASDNASPGLFVSTLQQDFRAFLDLLEEKANVNILASPEILAIDGQKARIQVGDRLGFRVTTTTTTASLESVEFIEVGTVLEVTPNITNEGVIRMMIHPKISSGVIGTTGLPTESTTEVNTEMIVKDGETIVIGGLLDASKQKSRSQVPILGDLPVLGKLFGRNTWIDNKREVMIMISPKLIGPVATPDMLARMEKAKSTAQYDEQGAFWKVTGLEKRSTKEKEQQRDPSMRAFVDDPVKTPLKEQTSSSTPNAGARTDSPAPAVLDMSAPVASSNVAKSEASAPAVLEPEKPVVVASAAVEEEGKSVVAEPAAPAVEAPVAKIEEDQPAAPETADVEAASAVPASPAETPAVVAAAPVAVAEAPAIAPEASAPATEAPAAAATGALPRGFTIQVATFKGSSRKADAETYQKHLLKKYGMASEAFNTSDDRFVCIYTGEYAERAEAVQACRELKKNTEFSASYVRTRKTGTIQQAVAETEGTNTDPRS